MKILLTIGAAYIALVLLLFLFQNQMLFFPDNILPYDPSVYDLEWEEVWFEAEDGVQLHGWYIPHEEPEATLLFSHGNAGNIAYRLELLQKLNNEAYSVFIYDYRGFGKSEGRPNEKGVYKDVRAAWHYLTEEKGLDGSEIVLYGRSLGGAVSAYLARETDPLALVLESTFTSVRAVASDHYPFVPSFLVWSDFATEKYLREIRSPVLILHSRDDSIIYFRHGEQLYESAGEPKRFVEIRGGHNDNYRVSGDLYFNELKRFIQESAQR